jgi:hypothetical protein
VKLTEKPDVRETKLVLKRSCQPITNAIYAARWSIIANDWLKASHDHVTRHDAAAKEGAFDPALCKLHQSPNVREEARIDVYDIRAYKEKLHKISKTSQENFQVRNLAAILLTVHS